MAVAADPDQIYDRARAEGRRRLFMPALGQVTTGFIAGVTIVFGIVALGIGVGHLEGVVGRNAAEVAGALAFPLGMVFLIVGRTELFSENVFDPVAAAIEGQTPAAWLLLFRLWEGSCCST